MAGTQGMTKKTYKLPDLAQLTASFAEVTDEEIAKGNLGPKPRGVQIAERTPIMKQFDAWAAEQYAAWAAADKPSEFGGGGVRKVDIDPDAVDGTKFLIRKSAEFVGKDNGGYGVRFGQPQALKNGRTRIAWMVVDKRERKAGDKSETNSTE